jgi:hypothetical protein
MAERLSSQAVREAKKNGLKRAATLAGSACR